MNQFIIVTIAVCSNIFVSQAQVDSLELLLISSENDTQKIHLLDELCNLTSRSEPSKAISYANNGLWLSKKNNYKIGLLFFYRNLGVLYIRLSNYVKALDYYLQLLQIAEGLHDEKEIAGSLIGIGSVYWYLEDHDKAIAYYQKALPIYNKLGHKEGIASSLSGVGIVYASQGTNHKAIDYYKQSLIIYKEIGYTEEIARTLNNIGIIYNEQQKYEKAISIFEQTLELQKKINYIRGIQHSLQNIGSAYAGLGEFENSINYIKNSLELGHEIGDKNSLMQGYAELSKVYEKQKKHKKALSYFKKQSEAKDSLFNEEKSKEIGKLEANYEMEKKLEEEKRLHEKQARLEAEAKSRQDNLQYMGIFIVLIFVFLGIFALARAAIPIKYVQGSVFFSFLLTFEFLLVLIDPWLELSTGGEPMYKLLINSSIAAIIFPIHHWLQTILTKRVIKPKSKKLHNGMMILMFSALVLSNSGLIAQDGSIQIKDAERSYKIAKEIKSLDAIKNASQLLSDLYEKESKYELALQYNKEARRAKDSLFNEEKSKEIGKIEARYEFEKQQAELKRQEEDQARIIAEQKARRDDLQYSGGFIFIIVLLIAITFSGKLHLSEKWAKGLIFFTFLLLFEFVLVYLDPHIEQWTGGEPALKLLINGALAAIIFPLHHFFESKLKSKVISNKQPIREQ